VYAVTIPLKNITRRISEMKRAQKLRVYRNSDEIITVGWLSHRAGGCGMEWSPRSIKSLMGNWQSTVTYRSTQEYRGDKFANPIYKMEHQFWQNLTFGRKTPKPHSIESVQPKESYGAPFVRWRRRRAAGRARSHQLFRKWFPMFGKRCPLLEIRFEGGRGNSLGTQPERALRFSIEVLGVYDRYCFYLRVCSSGIQTQIAYFKVPMQSSSLSRIIKDARITVYEKPCL